MVEYVGLDVSKEETAFCVKDAAGESLTERPKIGNQLEDHRLDG